MDTALDVVASGGGICVNQIGTMKNQPHLTRNREEDPGLRKGVPIR
jgi:hypothetical protein